MSDKHYTYDEIRYMDKILYELAIYEVSGGMMKTRLDQQEMIEFIRKVDLQYNGFKRNIQNGEYTFEFIKEHTMLKNGPVKRQHKNMTVEEEVEELLSQDFDALPDEHQDDTESLTPFNFLDFFITSQIKSDDSVLDKKSIPDYFTPPGLRKNNQRLDKTENKMGGLTFIGNSDLFNYKGKYTPPVDDEGKILSKSKKIEGKKDQEKTPKKTSRKRTRKNDNLSDKKGGKNN